eukprot:UN11051
MCRTIIIRRALHFPASGPSLGCFIYMLFGLLGGCIYFTSYKNFQ